MTIPVQRKLRTLDEARASRPAMPPLYAAAAREAINTAKRIEHASAYAVPDPGAHEAYDQARADLARLEQTSTGSFRDLLALNSAASTADPGA